MERLVSFLQLFVQQLFSQQGVSAVLLGAGAVGALALAVLAVLLALKKRLHPYRRALRLRERGDVSGAIGHLVLAQEDREARKQALLMKADLEVETGAYDQAARDYYRLIQMKTPGDGVDLLEVKKKLLLPLYRMEHLLELLRLCREVLHSERRSPEALYYLSLVYLGQLYAGEAGRMLEGVVRNRPRWHQALFALAVARSLERKYAPAAGCLARARSIEDLPVYRLVHAGLRCLEGGCEDARGILSTLPELESRYESKSQYLFYLRVRGLCGYRLGDYQEAERGLAMLCRELDSLRRAAARPEPIDRSGRASSFSTATGVYNEFGRAGDSGASGGPPAGGAAGSAGKDRARQGSVSAGSNASDEETGSGPGDRWRDYYRLKELALEEGKAHLVRVPSSPGRMLHIEGLTEASRAALGRVFVLVGGARFSDALGALEQVRADYPEVTGLRNLVAVIREAAQNGREDRQVSGQPTGRRDERRRDDARPGERGKGAAGLFCLEDYVQAWEIDSLRPYHLAAASGLLSRKRVSPGVLFRRDGQFGLDL